MIGALYLSACLALLIGWAAVCIGLGLAHIDLAYHRFVVWLKKEKTNAE